MLHSGLVSVSFRQHTVESIIHLTKEARLDAIEWGGDVHVPHGDLPCARRVRRLTLDAGLKVSSYGSYYWAGQQAEFAPVLDTAIELGAPVVRIWAGNKSSAESEIDWFGTVAEDINRVCQLASQADVSIALEYHPGTLTDTISSAAKLLCACPAAYSYWQQPIEDDIDKKLCSLQAVLPRLSNVHVYHKQGERRLPLACGVLDWAKYLPLIAQAPGSRYCLLEFFKADSTSQFKEDAKVLRMLLKQKESN